MLRKFRKIVFLTGAGISAESGLATFRDTNGLWNNYDAEVVASLHGFQANPSLVHQFYNELRKQMFAAQPNSAHLALTYLQQHSHADIQIITQNIDTLHEKALSQNVWHIHGQINQLRCINCGKITETWEPWAENHRCCSCFGELRPNIVFFGEEIFFSPKIEQLLNEADLFVAIGTSGTIPPASTFVCDVRQHSGLTIALNLEKPANYRDFDIVINGQISKTLPRFIEKLLIYQ